MPNEHAMPLADNADAPVASSMSEPVGTAAGDAIAGTSVEPAVEDILRMGLSEGLKAALEGPDPVAGLDKAVQTVADELSRQPVPQLESESFGQDGEVAGAIAALVRVALELNDPVAALEEGIESLAEALAARDAAEQERLQQTERAWVNQQEAYRHARFHRVNELIDVGYSLDHAVAITNANEAEIRARAAEAGRDPMQAIYRYAILNGYRGHRDVERAAKSRHAPAATELQADSVRDLADLARLSDKAFAEATKGHRWQALMR